MITKQVFIDIAERVGSTFAQVFLATVLAAAGAHVMWGDAAAVAGMAAFVSLLTSVVLWLTTHVHGLSNPYVDLFYRSGITFLQTLVAYATAAGVFSILDFGWSMALKASLVAAGTSLLKGLIGLNNPATLGASPLVVHLDDHRRPRPGPGKLPLVA